MSDTIDLSSKAFRLHTAHVQYTSGSACLAQPQRWQELEEFCWELVYVTGITSLQIVDEKNVSRCWLDVEGKWLRELLP